MAVAKMGKLIEVDIRKLWGHEQYDFSNWLAEKDNLELLREKSKTAHFLVRGLYPGVMQITKS